MQDFSASYKFGYYLGDCTSKLYRNLMDYSGINTFVLGFREGMKNNPSRTNKIVPEG
jgi:hypothetical protein